MKGVYVSVGRGGLEWMLWYHPDLLFVASPLFCPGPAVLMEEDAEQKSSPNSPTTEGDCLPGAAVCERLLTGSVWGRYSGLTPSLGLS